jgi:hypothetical protein
MSLQLGKALDRSYNLRLPFLDGYYNIGVYFNKRSTFLLFKVDADSVHRISKSTKITMFKNLESSKFAEIFLDLHSYRSGNLDIQNQFQSIRPEYHYDSNIILNETVNVAKIDMGENKFLFDTMTVYGLTLTSYSNEFIFIIAERQNIIKKLKKKVVRTTAIQLATSSTISLIDEFQIERKESLNNKLREIIKPSEEKEIIKLSDIDNI